MTRTTLAVLALFLLIPGRAAAEPVDRAKLRELAQLPTLSFLFGVGFNTRDGITLLNEKIDVPAEIAAVRQTLKGDASDAPRCHRLGQLYEDARHEKQSKLAYTRAVELFRQRVKAEPKNGYLAAQLGQALVCVEEIEEAETLLRQAVRLAPDDWRCWLALARFLDDKGADSLFGKQLSELFRQGVDPGRMLQALQKINPTPERIAGTRKLETEARDCYDKAVAAGPREAEPHRRRAMSRSYQGFISACLALLRGEPANPAMAMFAPESLPDLYQASKLDPEDYRAIGLAILTEILVAYMKNEPPPNARFGEGLPARVKQAAQESMDRLEQLSRHRDARVAAGASEVLGLVSMIVLGNPQRMATEFLRSVSLDPSREHAWEGLVFTLIAVERREEAEAVCREWLRRKDTAHKRLVLAKVLVERANLAQAEQELRAGLKLEPNSIRMHAAIAALLLKRGDDALLPPAGELLDRAEKLLEASTSREDRSDLTVTRSLHLALSGDVDGARKRLRQFLEQDRENKQARAALDLLESQPGGSYSIPPPSINPNRGGPGPIRPR